MFCLIHNHCKPWCINACYGLVPGLALDIMLAGVSCAAHKTDTQAQQQFNKAVAAVILDLSLDVIALAALASTIPQCNHSSGSLHCLSDMVAISYCLYSILATDRLPNSSDAI